MNNEENLMLFKKLFKETFYNTKFKTRRFYEFYQDLEGLQDTIAGPFYSIYKDGNCDYVFEGDREIFKGIKSCEDYLKWCLDIVKDYKNRVNELKAYCENEKKDKEVLLSKAIAMEKMSYLAVNIQKYILNE